MSDYCVIFSVESSTYPMQNRNSQHWILLTTSSITATTQQKQISFYQNYLTATLKVQLNCKQVQACESEYLKRSRRGVMCKPILMMSAHILAGSVPIIKSDLRAFAV